MSARGPALAQGLYYVGTGLWPFVSMKSFMAVTGPKFDGWLVRTVGALIGVVGTGLVAAALRRRITPELAFVGGGCAAALAAIGTWYPLKGRIAKVYLADAALQAGLAVWWARTGRALAKEQAKERASGKQGGEWADWRYQPHFPLE